MSFSSGFPCLLEINDETCEVIHPTKVRTGYRCQRIILKAGMQACPVIVLAVFGPEVDSFSFYVQYYSNLCFCLFSPVRSFHAHAGSSLHSGAVIWFTVQYN